MSRKAADQRHRLNLKMKVLKHYGESCKNCGFDDFRALTIDHTEDNGAEERASLGGKQFAGHNFYAWLIKQGFPKGYQTLCFNCNLIKQWDLTHIIPSGAVVAQLAVNETVAGSNPALGAK